MYYMDAPFTYYVKCKIYDTLMDLTDRSACTVHRAYSEFMGKTFQAAQLTHERFLAIDHFCKVFFGICQTELPQASGV